MATISTLLVDDNNDFLQAVMNFLSIDGRLKVVGLAHSGLEAIEKVKLLGPALVLMDWALPEMNGIEATRHLKRREESPCIIMLTQHDTPIHRAMAAAAGADGFVAKSDFDACLMALIAAVCPAQAGKTAVLEPDVSSLAA